MGKKNWLTKTLAIAGTILVIIPVIAPIVFSVIRLFSIGKFQFDYLMPAELGLLVLIGGGLLIWAAIRTKMYLKWLAWSLGLAVLLVFGGQGLAVVTGLASGMIDAAGWQYTLVLVSIIGYDLALISLMIGGIMLTVQLFLQARK